MDVSYRSIAKLLARGMPIDGQDYSDIIEGYIKSIEAMPPEQQSTLKSAYIFSRKAPEAERQDLFQHLVAHGLAVLASWPKPILNTAGFCYGVARNEWKFWTRKRKGRLKILGGGFLSLNEPVRDSLDGDIELQDAIAGEVEFESKLNSELDCQAVLNTLPDRLKTILAKRLNGYTISSADQKALSRYIKKNGDTIRELITV